MAPFLVALSAMLAGATPDVEGDLYAALKAQGIVMRPDMNMIFVAQAVEGKKLVNPVLIRMDASGKVEMVCQAREGDLRVDQKKHRVVIHLVKGKAELENGSAMEFAERDFTVDLPGKN